MILNRALSLQMVAGVNSANDVLLLGRLESLDSHYGFSRMKFSPVHFSSYPV